MSDSSIVSPAGPPVDVARNKLLATIEQQLVALNTASATLNTTLGALATALGALFPAFGSLSSTATTGAATLPAFPVGFVEVTLPGGGAAKIPYYNP
jgi:hypothetical protein